MRHGGASSALLRHPPSDPTRGLRMTNSECLVVHLRFLGGEEHVCELLSVSDRVDAAGDDSIGSFAADDELSEVLIAGDGMAFLAGRSSHFQLSGPSSDGDAVVVDGEPQIELVLGERGS